jgi:renal tumor antigen
MDLWGAGCVMFEITSLYPLFPGSNEVDQINRIHKVLGTPSSEILQKFRSKGASHISFDFPPQKGVGIAQLVPHASADCVDLLTKMLKYDASERITSREAMRHPYFRDIRDVEMSQSKGHGASHGVASKSFNDNASKSGTQQDGQSNNKYGSSNKSSKGLPEISKEASNSKSGHHGSGTHNQGGQQPKYAPQQKGGGIAVAGNNSQVNNQSSNQAADKSNLPPIGHGGHNSKYANNNPGVPNQQKKRRKYRMAYQQDTRHRRNGHNAENVMKAYGVPKPIGGGQAEAAPSKSKYGGGGGGNKYGRK